MTSIYSRLLRAQQNAAKLIETHTGFTPGQFEIICVALKHPVRKVIQTDESIWTQYDLSYLVSAGYVKHTPYRMPLGDSRPLGGVHPYLTLTNKVDGLVLVFERLEREVEEYMQGVFTVTIAEGDMYVDDILDTLISAEIIKEE